MRISATIASIPLAALIGVAAQSQETLLHTPDEAVLACQARAGHEIQTRHGRTAEPAGPFETQRFDGGWRVEGVYLASGDDGDQEFDVSCDVGADGVELTTTARTN